MNTTLSFRFIPILLSISILIPVAANAALTPKEALGKIIFFDENLSEPAGQSCASCHDPKSGFADPDKNLPVSEGVITGKFGGRNAPSAAYAAFTPTFSFRMGRPIGGQFWDGRAATLEDQAKGPFLNPVEMNNPDKAAVIQDIMNSDYADQFVTVYGVNAFVDIDIAYDNVADAIATYERSDEVNRFSSKFDAVSAGNEQFTAEETLGLQLFNGQALCSQCHTTTQMMMNSGPIVFTDFRYHNIGVPKNTEFPLDNVPADSVDNGLGAAQNNASLNGLFKTPHLRNVTLSGPYMHNGLLKTLKEVIHFYNTRDVPGLWPAPEVTTNLNTRAVGNLGLTDAQEDAIVAFLKTLEDR